MTTELHSLSKHAAVNVDIPDGISIKVIGLGGVGGILVRYLTVFLVSGGTQGRLVLIDGDSFENENQARMVFSKLGNKAAVLENELSGLSDDSRLSVTSIEEYVTEENLKQYVHENDIVLLAVDNHKTRQIVNARCAELGGVCLISGGNDGVGEDSSGRFVRGTFGNVQIYVRRGGDDQCAGLTKFHPEIEDPADQLPTEVGCGAMLPSVPQILFTNLMTATSMLNALWLHLAGELHYSELCFDVFDGVMRPMPHKGPKAAEQVQSAPKTVG